MATTSEVLLVILVLTSVHAFEDKAEETDSSASNNCSINDDVVTLHGLSEAQRSEVNVMADVLVDDTNNNTNVSHLRTITVPRDWDEDIPKLKFPKTSIDKRYRMANLHLNQRLYIFDFLRGFLHFIQPYDVPTGLLKDFIENRITTSKLISASMHIEAILLVIMALSCIMACVVPGTELWLTCRPLRDDYKPHKHPTVLAFLLAISVLLLGTCTVTMIVCNEAASSGVEKLPIAVETALQDLKDFHGDTTTQLRQCIGRSLDIASEAILADLDNVEELLGKPVQAELAVETGLDVALDALLDLANATQELSNKVESLAKEAERARDLGTQLNRETDEIRRDLQSAVRECSGQDRSLCTIIDPTGLRLTLSLERFLKDDRLLRLRETNRDSLLDAARQARGEYLYVPDHVARRTLDIRNQIRREISVVRARIFDEARNMEASSTELSKQLQSARNVADYAMPYINEFEHIRWLVGLGTFMSILPIWFLLLGALCCRCESSEDRVRPTLLCAVFTSCLVSIALWAIFAASLALSAHTEMLLCRPLHDPEYRTIEVILESRAFLGRRFNVPLKDLFEKCQANEAAYPAFQLERTMKLEELTAHWKWADLNRAKSKLKVDLRGLKIVTPNLQQRLQSLLYACGPNLTEHRVTIQGPILSKDLNALSAQIESVARQLSDGNVARNLQLVGLSMRELSTRRVKPLMKLQDDLVYQIAVLELRLQPVQRQINQSIAHLKTIQYYIDNQGEKITQLKVKRYADRLGGYLDQWRAYVLSEMASGVAKCRPLWEILEGAGLLFCDHILGPLNGFWFVTAISAIVLMMSTPTAHILSLVYKRSASSKKDTSLLPARSESPETMVVMDRETWQSPESSPPQDGW